MKPEHLTHTFEPVFDRKSKILILGSFPSVKSRENEFYYGHPKNRFWKVLARILDEDVPDSIQEKKAFLLSHHIALWDVIASCDIEASSDSSIRNVTANDITVILRKAPIEAIFTNGAKAHELCLKYCKKEGMPDPQKLPSTSPANAAWSLERLAAAWGEAISAVSMNGVRFSAQI